MPTINALSRARILTSLSVFTVALLLGGCSKNNGNPVSSQQSSTVQGQVSNQSGLGKKSASGSGVSGAVVSLAQIQVDGSLKTVSTTSVQTDANGRFSLSTDLDGVNDLIVVASQGSNEWEGIVSADVKHGTTVFCQPLTDQTTVQAQAYSKLIADGKGSEVTPADLQLFVTESVATSMSGNASLVAQLAAALEAESEARATAFTEFNITASQLQAAESARDQAQVSLESSLYSAEGDSLADNAALQGYYAATVGAYVAAGIPIEVMAKTEDISCAALTNFSTSMSAGPEFSVERSAAMVRSALIGQAVLSQLQAGGASQAEIASADSANAALTASLEYSQSSNQISAAFAGYHASIMAQLDAMTGVDSTEISSADVDINSSGGAYADLQTALGAATTTGAIVQAYMTFYGAVETMMQGMGGMSSAQLDASAQALMLIDSDF